MANIILEDLLHKVQDWFHVRNLQDGDPNAQYLKLIEEIGEIESAPDYDKLVDAYGDTFVVAIGLCLQTGTSFEDILVELTKVAKGPKQEVKSRNTLVEVSNLAADLARGRDISNSLFEVLSTVVIRAVDTGTTIQYCLQVAYEEIKGRKGMLLNGVYVKYEDLSDENKAKLDAKTC